MEKIFSYLKTSEKKYLQKMEIFCNFKFFPQYMKSLQLWVLMEALAPSYCIKVKDM